MSAPSIAQATQRYIWPWQLSQVKRATEHDFVAFVQSHFDVGGDHVRFIIGPKSIYRTRVAEDAQRILVDDAKQYIKPQTGLGIDPVRTLLGGGGLVMLNGADWRRHRRMVQPSFMRSRIVATAPTMREVARQHVAALPRGEVLDIHRFFSRLTMDLACRLLFDVPMGQDYDEVRGLLDDVNRGLAKVATIPHWMPTPANFSYKAAIGRLDAFLFKLIDDRLALGREALAARTDVLSTLCLAADDEDDRTFTRRELRNEIVTLFLAGHDTTALALTWAAYELGKNPDVAARLAEEVGAGDHRPYVRAVLDETLRLYPSAFAVLRETIEPTTLGPFDVPAGANIAIWSIFIHRHPRYWPEPLRFDPERFAGGVPDDLQPGAYLPFGAGTRTCIGKHFALMEAGIVLEELLRAVRLDTTMAEPPRFATGPTLSPKGGVLARVDRA